MKRLLFLCGVPILAFGTALSACSKTRDANAAPPPTVAAPSVAVPAPPIAGKPDAGKSGASDQIGRVENEPILQAMRKIFSETNPQQMNAGIKKARDALLKALRALPQEGIEIKEKEASFANHQGYMVPVTFQDRAAYERFSRGTFDNSEKSKSIFQTWPFGSGRTRIAVNSERETEVSVFLLVKSLPVERRLEQFNHDYKRSK
jgi:hypothetical protein